MDYMCDDDLRKVRISERASGLCFKRISYLLIFKHFSIIAVDPLKIIIYGSPREHLFLAGPFFSRDTQKQRDNPVCVLEFLQCLANNF